MYFMKKILCISVVLDCAKKWFSVNAELHNKKGEGMVRVAETQWILESHNQKFYNYTVWTGRNHEKNSVVGFSVADGFICLWRGIFRSKFRLRNLHENFHEPG